MLASLTVEEIFLFYLGHIISAVFKNVASAKKMKKQ